MYLHLHLVTLLKNSDDRGSLVWLYKLSVPGRQDRLLHMYMGLCELVQRPSTNLVIVSVKEPDSICEAIWCSTCEPWIALRPHLPALHTKYKSRLQKEF